MRNTFSSKKLLALIIVVVVAGAAVVVAAVLNNRAPDESNTDLPVTTADDTVDNVDNTSGDASAEPAPNNDASGNEGVIIYDHPEGWEEQAAAELRESVESITGNVIGEIDSQDQPEGASPETIVSVDKGGYDIVIKGALIHGSTGVTLYDEHGAVVAERGHFMIDDEFRIVNAAAGKYRIVVERLDVEGVIVNCFLKIILELTKPEIEIPGLIATAELHVANPYDATMVFESEGNSTTIAAKGSAVVVLPEGRNAISYYLKDGDLVSAQIDDEIIVDTKPPVITLDNTYENNGKIVFNMSVNENVEYIRINGEERGLYGGANPDGSYPFAHMEPVGTKSITVEARDIVGNVSRTVISA